MPIPTPFHEKIAPLCTSHEWRNWSGYLAPVTYGPTHEVEYFAFRNAAGLIDVTPLYKYEVQGPDAERLLDRVITRDVSKCKIGQVLYTPWCDEAGKIIDDGTVQRFSRDRFRVTAADPSLRWFQDCAYGMDVTIEDISEQVAALALQGPRSREILSEVTSGADLNSLKFFYLAEGQIAGIPVVVTRTGYTGDLGYEIWIDREQAGTIWDTLMSAGRRYGIHPAGLAALDIVRIEAGLLLIEVDYISSIKAVIPSRFSSPFEAGLGWAVKLKKRADFVGRKALLQEKARGSYWRFAGLVIDWVELEKRFAKADLPPQVAGRASRLAVPVYRNGHQVGQATSSTFSPILKKYIALATLEADKVGFGDQVDLELTVEFTRQLVPATVTRLPFYDPPQKRK